MAQQHRAVVREGDEYVCRACRKRWSCDDTEVPECEPITIILEHNPSSESERREYKRRARR